MTKLVSALFLTAAATIAAPALAEPATHPIAFQRDGIHYVGTIADRADGTRLIAGHEVESGHTFALTVTKGMVSGIYDHQYVSYDAPRRTVAKPATTASTTVASATGM